MAIAFDSTTGGGVGVSCGRPDIYDNMEDFTLCAWINPQTWGQSSYGRIISKEHSSHGWMLFVDDSLGTETLRFVRWRTLWDTDFQCVNYSLSLDKWQHVAVTATLASTQIYINGVAASSYYYDAGSGDLGNDNYDYVYIGNRQYGYRGFYGWISDARIYDTALSANQISVIAASRGHDSILKGKIGHWPMNEHAPYVELGTSPVKDVSESRQDGYGSETDMIYAHDIISVRKRC